MKIAFLGPSAFAVPALKALADDGVLDNKTVVAAIKKYDIDPDRPDPVTL